ncbi:unnamed protein product, partial [Darwinula stevensoni]
HFSDISETFLRRLRPSQDRGTYLKRIHRLLLQNKEKLARILTRENGKPLKESLGEVEFSASFFEWYAEEARRLYGEHIPGTAESKVCIHVREPVGVAALITP